MTPDEIKLLGDSEIETGKVMATGLGIVSAASLVIISLFTVAVMPDLLLVVFLLTVGLGSAAATGALFWAWRRRNTLIALFMGYALPAPESARSTPALPETKQIEIVAAQDSSRGGERLIHGFDPAMLAWLCDCLSNGMPWTETTLEKMRVPHMFPPARFGKAEGDTPYNRLFNSERGLFIRAGIIIERGGEGNKPGKLAIRSPLTMMELLKALPENDKLPG